MGSILKILTDTPCEIYCDFEFKGEVLLNSIFKLELKKGKYILEFVSIDNNKYKISQEYIMQSNDEQDLLKVHFLDIIDAQKREDEFWRIAEIKETFQDIYKGYEKIKEKYNFVSGHDAIGLDCVNIGGELDDMMGWFIGGGKFGCVNKLGEIQIPIIYDKEIRFSNKNVTIAHRGDEKFFINKFGEIAFDNIFDEVENFVNDYCVVSNDGRYGVIDSFRKIITPLQYCSIKLLNDEQNQTTIWAKLNNKWGVLDLNNNIISSFNYDEICINSTTISIRINDFWGVSKYNGEIISPIEYEFVTLLGVKQNRTLVKRKNKFGVLNFILNNCKLSSSDKNELDEIVPCSYDAIYDEYGRETEKFSDFHNLRYINKNEDLTLTCHRYNEEGNIVGEFTCEKFIQNKIWNNNKCGIIGWTGEAIIPCEYDEIDCLTAGYKVKKENFWGVISNSGEVLSDCIYHKIDEVDYYYKIDEAEQIFAIVVIDNKYRMLMQSPYEHILRQVGDEYDMIEYISDDNNEDFIRFFAVKLGNNWAIVNLLDFEFITEFIYISVYSISNKEVETVQIIDNRRLYGVYSVLERKEIVECKYLEYQLFRNKNSNCVAVYDKYLKKEGIILEKNNKVIVPFLYDYIRIYSGFKSSFFVIGKDIEYDLNCLHEIKNRKYAIVNTRMELLSNYIFGEFRTSSGHPNYIFIYLPNFGKADFDLDYKDIEFNAPFFDYQITKKINNSNEYETISTKPFKNLTLFIDIETTGLSIKDDESYENLNNWPYIVQLGFILYDDNFGKLSERSIVLKPENYNIPFESTRIHGISHDFALNKGKNRLDALSFMDLILSNVEVVIGHNVEFDLNTLKCEILRAKKSENILFQNINHKVIDTMKMGSNICRIPSHKPWETYKWPKLDELYTKLFNKSFEGQHNALNDIKATYDCYFEMINNINYNIPNNWER